MKLLTLGSVVLRVNGALENMKDNAAVALLRAQTVPERASVMASREQNSFAVARREVFVTLVYPAGDLAEVDFFEVLVDLAGKRTKAWMFAMRLMHSGRDFACLSPERRSTPGERK